MGAHGSARDPTSWGRYIPLRRVGRGATGLVYAAFDPMLERQVAIKVVRPSPWAGETMDRATERLVRESRALAALSAPNVLSIYDVGEQDGQVYIVTELVRGQSLYHWLLRTRPATEIIARFIDAGRGLAAAHRAGIVHRDFKPANVMIGEDGRVRVLDFGLARRRRPPTGGGHVSGAPTSEQRLTAPGDAVGTPGYMAPEQLVGLEAGPYSDQFAFCVALWEALAIRHPFPADTLSGLAKRVATTAPVGDPAAGTTIRAALLRGMSVRPSRRHTDMDALVRALTRTQIHPWRRAALIGAGAAIVGAGAVPAAVAATQTPDPCRGAAQEMTASWNPQIRAEVGQRLADAPAHDAATVAVDVTTRLDAFAADWVTMHTEACEATTVHATQSAKVMDRRMGCLHRSKDDLDAAVALLRRADADVAQRAPTIVDGLPTVGSCSDVRGPL